MGSESQPPRGSAALAQHWVARRDQGLNVAERRALREWLAADPRHAAAFAAADTRASEFDWPLHSGTIDQVLEGLTARERKRRTARLVAAGAAVVIILLALAAGQFSRLASPVAASNLTVLAPSTRTLPDGTIVELKDDAEIIVNFEGVPRAVTLVRGTAHFDVSRDPTRPFVVTAAEVTARALGTAFVVELHSQSVSVLVTKGTVAVDHAPTSEPVLPGPDQTLRQPLAVLDAGRSVNVSLAQAIASRPAVNALPSAELEEKLSWRIPRVEFSGTPLRDVIDTLNRHNRRQFVLADRSLGGLALSGVLRADKTEALVKMLESEFAVTAEQREQQIILRRARK